jgi:hypothetical protein
LPQTGERTARRKEEGGDYRNELVEEDDEEVGGIDADTLFGGLDDDDLWAGVAPTPRTAVMAKISPTAKREQTLSRAVIKTTASTEETKS